MSYLYPQLLCCSSTILLVNEGNNMFSGQCLKCGQIYNLEVVDKESKNNNSDFAPEGYKWMISMENTICEDDDGNTLLFSDKGTALDYIIDNELENAEIILKELN